jgi:cytoskeleton protein RodZ
MTPVGETLRRERLKRNLGFDTISRELKISTRFLEAIENEQYEKLPGGVFAKSFVRQYARLLGLDEEDLAGQLNGVITSEPDISQLVEKPKAASVAPIQVPKVEEWQTVGDKGFRWTGSLSAAAMVVVVMLICSAVYGWLQRPKSPVVIRSAATAQTAASTPVPQPAAPPAAAPTQTPPVETAAAAPAPAQNPEPPKPGEAKLGDTKLTESKLTETKPAEANAAVRLADAKNAPAEPKPAQVPPPAPPADATVHVQIVADEAVWILARTDGKYAFSGTLSPGDSRTVDGVKDVVLRLGNAGGVSISLNGKPVGSVGPKGQPRTLQLTSGGFHIVPAKPPAAPVDPIDRF